MPLPKFALGNRKFAEALVKSRGARTKVAIRNALTRLGHEDGQEIQLTSDGLGGGETGPISRGTCERGDSGCSATCGVSWHPGIRPTPEFEPVPPKGRRRAAVPVRKRYKIRPPRLLEPDAEARSMWTG